MNISGRHRTDQAARQARGLVAVGSGVPLLGFGFQWALTAVGGTTGVLYAGYGESLAGYATLGSIGLPAVSIALFCLVMLTSATIRNFWQLRSLRHAAALCGVLGVALVSLAPTAGNAIDSVFWTGIVLEGCSSSLLLVFWSELYSHLEQRRIAVYVGSSITLGACITWVCTLLPAAIAIAAVALLPLASVALLPRAAARAVRSPNDKIATDDLPTVRHPHLAFARLLLGLVVFGIAFELFPAYLANGRLVDEWGRTSVAIAAQGAAGLLVALGFRSVSDISAQSLFRLVLPIVSAGFLIVTLLGKPWGDWAYALMSAGETVLDVVIWMLLARMAIQLARPPSFVYASGRLCAHVGRILGASLGPFAITTYAEAGSIALITACCVMMYVLLLAGSFMIDVRPAAPGGFDAGNSPRQTQTPDPPPPTIEQTCQKIARDHGLSPRELDVLTLLAKGRSVPFIQQELSIAESTAKTHSHRVYEKLGVHSKQELIDFVDRYNRPGNTRVL